MNNVKELVSAIHATPQKAVLAITGGGSEAIGELLRHGQGSNTLLEAVVPYDQKAFDSFVRGTPDKYCSPGAARDLAMAAYQRGLRLLGENSTAVVGVGATSSLVKENERQGRQHNAYISVQTAQQTATYFLDHNQLAGDRENQEAQVAEEILKALGHACSVVNHPTFSTTQAVPEQFRVIHGLQQFVSFDPFNKVYKELPVGSRKLIFPGAFNPWHDGHERMAAKAHELTGWPVDLEVTVRNVDKPALNYTDLQDRLAGCVSASLHKPWMGCVHLSGTPTFVDKIRAFPGATFIVGWDTFKRIADPKYAGNLPDVLNTLYQCGARFMVFHRVLNGKSSADEDIGFIPPGLLNLSRIIGPDEFTPSNTSSTDIRRRA